MTPIPTELRELLERIVAGDVGRMIYAKLATGQATETDDGKAWLELRALLATPPADAADMGGLAGEEVVAWCTPERDRVITEITKAGARADGGAMLSSVQPYSEPLMTVAKHRQQAGKLVEALRKIHFRADCFVEDDMDMRVPSIEAIVRIAGEALADWEKTSCGK